MPPVNLPAFCDQQVKSTPPIKSCQHDIMRLFS
nr:MAG TPA: hypothetical protein [Caudoviricetes sp.]